MLLQHLNSFRLSLLILISTSLMCSAATQARECFSQAPEWVQLGDAYFELEPVPAFTPEQATQLHTIYPLLTGDWRGSSEEITCLGTETNPDLKSDFADIKAEITVTNDNLILRINKDDQNNHNITQDKLILVENKLTRQLELSDTRIIAQAKYRQATRSSGARLMDVRTGLQLDAGSLNITVIRYTNGVYTGEDHLRLVR